MSRIARLATLSVVLVSGCAGETRAPASSPAATVAPRGTVAPPASALPPVVSEAASDGELGVPECDQFAEKYLACLEKVPESGRAAARQTFDQVRAHWRRVAANPQRRASLASACRQHEALTRKAMQRYECQW